MKMLKELSFVLSSCIICMSTTSLFGRGDAANTPQPLAAAVEPNTGESKLFLPGREVRIETDNKDVGGGCFLVYVPTDYNENRKWPLIVYYHGAGEPLSTQRFQTATDSKGFIIAAMEFGDAPEGTVTQGQYMAYIRREQRSVEAAKVYIARHLKMDRDKMLLAGVSRGGWLVTDMADLNASPWTGMAVFCAGRRGIIPQMAGGSVRGKNIYIGTGESDQNLEAAKKAADDYRRRAAKVTFDIYPGLGHAVDPNSPALRKWLNDIAKGQKPKSLKVPDPNASSGNSAERRN
jgi:dienelactone hydrolase